MFILEELEHARKRNARIYGEIKGYNFTFEGQKWIGDWQMALGVNLLCPHLAHYSMKGPAKRDYPPSYSYQSPWWRHYKYVADYQARLTWALLQGRPARDVLLNATKALSMGAMQ